MILGVEDDHRVGACNGDPERPIERLATQILVQLPLVVPNGDAFIAQQRGQQSSEGHVLMDITEERASI
jgi:hypothetical protein